MKSKYAISLLTISFVSILFISCVSTNIASFKDPSYRNASFGRFLVIANFKKMETVQKVEDAVVGRFKEWGVYAIANSSLLPPIREYSDDEKRNAFIDEHLDCYIIISPAGVNNATLYVPSISSTNANVSASRNKASGSSTTVTSTGGERDVVSSVDTKAELYDFQNGHIVWKAEANTDIKYNAYGQTFAQVNDVIFSFCSNMVDELNKKSLLKSTSK